MKFSVYFCYFFTACQFFSQGLINLSHFLRKTLLVSSKVTISSALYLFHSTQLPHCWAISHLKQWRDHLAVLFSRRCSRLAALHCAPHAMTFFCSLFSQTYCRVCAFVFRACIHQHTQTQVSYLTLLSRVSVYAHRSFSTLCVFVETSVCSQTHTLAQWLLRVLHLTNFVAIVPREQRARKHLQQKKRLSPSLGKDCT